MDLPTEAAQNSGSVSVTLREANGTALPSGLRLLLRRTDNNGSPEENRVVEKDVTEFANLPAGEYRFTVLGESRTLPVVALAQDGKPVRSKRLHIAGPNPVHIDLTLSLYAPVLEGFAQHEGKGFPGAMVILVPPRADTSEELFRRDQSDLDGSFVLPNVVPGNYLLIAIENGWSLRWNDPAALLPYLLHALPVAVPRSGAATVHLPDPITTQRR